MTVAIADVGCHGRLDLTFTVSDGRTIIRDSYCETPFKITRLLDPRPFEPAHLILMHSTAGVFGGDELECSINVESGASVRITQQSATRIHPSNGRLAQQTVHIKLEARAQLEFECDPIIPFAGSRLNQKTSIEVAPGSSLCYWECMMAGRIGKNERWKFAELASETCLTSNERILYLDRFRLRPDKDNPSAQWIMGDAAYLGTGLYYGSLASELTSNLHNILPEAGIDLPTADLVVARVIAGNGPDFHRHRHTWSNAANIQSRRTRSTSPLLAKL